MQVEAPAPELALAVSQESILSHFYSNFYVVFNYKITHNKKILRKSLILHLCVCVIVSVWVSGFS